MLRILVTAFLLLAPPQVDTFKKEIAPLQSAVDSVISSTGSQVLQRSMATYLEGYGVVVSLEIAFDTPPNPFGGFKTPVEARSVVAHRRQDLQEKMSAFMKQRVAMTESIGATESLAIAIHVLNTNPADVKNLPLQIQMTVKKQAPDQVSIREF
jgi:hypothetical protein